MQTRTTEETFTATPVEQPEVDQVASPAAPTTEEVVEFIRHDAATSPRDYLGEVHVPHGGE